MPGRLKDGVRCNKIHYTLQIPLLLSPQKSQISLTDLRLYRFSVN